MGRSLSVPIQTLSPAEKEVATIPAEGLIVKYTSSARLSKIGRKEVCRMVLTHGDNEEPEETKERLSRVERVKG